MVENKVVELQDNVTKLSKRGQIHNEIKSYNSAMNKELDTLRKILDKKQREIDNTENNEYDSNIKPLRSMLFSLLSVPTFLNSKIRLSRVSLNNMTTDYHNIMLFYFSLDKIPCPVHT